MLKLIVSEPREPAEVAAPPAAESATEAKARPALKVIAGGGRAVRNPANLREEEFDSLKLPG